MASGVTFWQFPEEEKEFLDFLQKTGTVVAIPSGLVDSESELEPQPLIEHIDKFDPDQILIGLEQHAAQRITEHVVIGGKHKLCVASSSSCVVLYRRGKYRDSDKLGQFNLSAYWKRLDESKTMFLEKDPAFKRWGDSLLRWIRKHTPEWHRFKGYRVTSKVKAAIESGRLEIVP